MRTSEKCSSTTFIQVDICHRMGSFANFVLGDLDLHFQGKTLPCYALIKKIHRPASTVTDSAVELLLFHPSVHTSFRSSIRLSFRQPIRPSIRRSSSKLQKKTVKSSTINHRLIQRDKKSIFSVAFDDAYIGVNVYFVQHDQNAAGYFVLFPE